MASAPNIFPLLISFKLETFDHFVNEFPCLPLTRQDHLNLNKIQQRHSLTIQGILEYSQMKAIDLALRGEGK